MVLISKMLDQKFCWFLLLVQFLLLSLAQKDKTDVMSGFKCAKDSKGILTSNVAGGLCVTSTTQTYSTIGNDDLVKDPRADALSQKWEDTNFDKSWQLEVFPMMHNSQPVFGWFHIVLTGEPSTASIIIIMGILDSKYFYSPPAGQFYWTNTQNGDCSESPLKSANKDKFVPCHFAVDPLPFAGRIFVDRTPASGGLQKRYDLNFKVSFPRCDTEEKDNYGIFFRALVIGKTGSSANLLRYAKTKHVDFTERVKYVVALDPFPPQDNGLKCSDPNMPSWVGSVTDLNQDTNDDRKIPRQEKKIKSCTAESCFTAHYWEGRCQPEPQGFVHYNFPYICEQRGPNPQNMSDYYKDYVPRVKLATTVCVNETNCTDTLTQRELFGEDVASPIGKYIWGARKGHGVLMSVASFLAYPLSTYFARYYKETYMKTRAVINLHVWYAAHICGSFIVLSFIISGTGVGIYGRLFYGHSTSLCGMAHRYFGWLGAALFLVGMITSGFRIAPIPIRKVTIFVHFLTGMFYQSVVVTGLSMITCACIPGSPPGTEKTDKGEAGSFALFWVLTIVWLLFEIVMNILASLQIRGADVSSEFIPKRTRVFGLIYMPSLTPDSTKDLVGNERRKFLLHVYTLGNSIITILALILIIYPDDKGRYFGIMELTHFRNGSNRFADNYDEYADLVDD